MFIQSTEHNRWFSAEGIRRSAVNYLSQGGREYPSLSARNSYSTRKPPDPENQLLVVMGFMILDLIHQRQMGGGVNVVESQQREQVNL